MKQKYELKDGKILKFGHTMFLEDVVYELNSLDNKNKRHIQHYKDGIEDVKSRHPDLFKK